jgi:BASS family bile acid:Na+ symporter
MRRGGTLRPAPRCVPRRNLLRSVPHEVEGPMTDSPLITIGLPVALAIIMFGLGLSLTAEDFRRVARSPRAVAVALVLQVLVLPVIAFGLVQAFDVEPLLAVGVMLLAASPGGTTANLFSHLFRGDVALNVTLTAINSVLAAVSIPLITNLAISYFDASGELGCSSRRSCRSSRSS